MKHLTAQLLQTMPLPSLESGDKNARGSVLIVGGSRQVAGAVMLAGVGALRAGAGRVRIATCKSHASAIGVTFPEAFVLGLEETEEGDIAAGDMPRLLPLVEQADSVVIGPGMAEQGAAETIVRAIVEESTARRSFLLDARAIKSVRAAAGGALPASRIVLTPQGGELASLMNRKRDELEADPVRWASEAAQTYSAVVAFKGPKTVIAAPGREPSIGEEHVGLATSGSGDVLAGVIAGLLARGADPFQATCWGVYLHAEAGRRLAQDIGKLGFLAHELLPQIPKLMNSL